MSGSRRPGVPLFAAFVVCLVWAAPLLFSAQQPERAPTAAPVLSDAEIERFLLDARIVRTGRTEKGITGSIRATLTDGTRTHDAHIQTVDESKREFQSSRSVEFNFRDSWTFNVAGYKLGLDPGAGQALRESLVWVGQARKQEANR